MIQRIQSLFLLLSLILSILLVFIPFAQVYHPDAGIFSIKSTGMFQIVQDKELLQAKIYPLLIIVAVTLVFQTFTLFLYRKRVLQIRLCNLSSLFHFGVLILGIYYIYQAANNNGSTIEYGLSLIFPLICIVSNFIASRYILKDEKLIKSLDRLR